MGGWLMGDMVEDRRTKYFAKFKFYQWGSRSSGGGAPHSTRTPPPPPPKLKINTIRTGQVERALRRQGVQLGRVRGCQICIGWNPVRRRMSIEGSLSLMVVGSLNTKQIRRGIGGCGDYDHTGKGGGGGSGRFATEDSEGDWET